MSERVPPVEAKVFHASERMHQRYEYGELYSDQIVALSQVRKEKNIVSDRLRQGIRDNGLINPIDVACVDEPLLKNYMDFVRITWGDGASFDEICHLAQGSGRFNLLIAGHSRHQAIVDNEYEATQRSGVRTLYPIPVKLHAVDSVWDIIRLQLDENVHSQPPKERQAIALVEAYRYGQQTGAWQTVDEFLSESDEGVSKSFMKQAMLFERLPPEIRSYILSGPIPYHVGVELGLSVPVLRELYNAQYGDTADIDLLVRQELAIQCNTIVATNLNSTAGKAKIKALRAHWRARLETLRGSDEHAMELTFVIAADAGRAMAQKQQREIERQLRELAQLKWLSVDTMVRLSAPFIGEHNIDALLDEERMSAKKILARTERLGTISLNSFELE